MIFPYRGEQVTPADFGTLDGSGLYQPVDYDAGYNSLWYRDGDSASPGDADFFCWFSPSMWSYDGAVDVTLGECNFFAVCGPGTACTVEVSQAVDVGYTYAGPWDWQTVTTLTLGPGRTLLLPLADATKALGVDAMWDDSPPVLRVKVLSGTLDLDTLELQLEPPGGLQVSDGSTWADYVDSRVVLAQPLRVSVGWWASTASRNQGPSAPTPNLDEINAALTDAEASQGGSEAFANTWVPTTVDVADGLDNSPGSGGPGHQSLMGESTFWWHSPDFTNYYATCRRWTMAAVYWWDEYPTNYHETNPTAAARIQPEFEVPHWERADVGNYDPDPDGEWGTVGWYANASRSFAYNRHGSPGYPPSGDPPDGPQRSPLTLANGAPIAWSPASAPVSYPMPAEGAGPPLGTAWEPGYNGSGQIASYSIPFSPETTELMEAHEPGAGNNFTVIDHGQRGELDSYAYGAGGSPAIYNTTQTEFLGYLELQPPRCRWMRPNWVPSPEAVPTVRPLRLMQRGDGLGMGSGRVYSTGTRQSSTRVFGPL